MSWKPGHCTHNLSISQTTNTACRACTYIDAEVMHVVYRRPLGQWCCGGDDDDDDDDDDDGGGDGDGGDDMTNIVFIPSQEQ